MEEQASLGMRILERVLKDTSSMGNFSLFLPGREDELQVLPGSRRSSRFHTVG